jgi:hypothetical protein
MPNSGIDYVRAPLPTREVAHTRSRQAAERRNRFAAKHPAINFSSRLEDGRLVFEVSEPGRPAWATNDADAMMDDLEARYPNE